MDKAQAELKALSSEAKEHLKHSVRGLLTTLRIEVEIAKNDIEKAEERLKEADKDICLYASKIDELFSL